MRRSIILGSVTLLLLLGGASPGRATVPVLQIDGRGFGHGVGMAQDGAYWMGKGGSTTAQILGQFYPGTTVGKASGTVRVVVLTSGDGSASLGFPSGGEVRDSLSGGQSAGFPVRIDPGGQVSVHFDGQRYTVGASSSAHFNSVAPSSQPSPSRPGVSTGGSGLGAGATTADDSTTTTSIDLPTSTTSTTLIAPPPTSTTTVVSPTTTTKPPSPPPPGSASSTNPLWGVPSSNGTVSVPVRNRRYRGVIEATGAAGPLRLVNQVDVETYLKGMGEVRNPSWPRASLQAQAVAARTYALRAMSNPGGGEICDDQRCQVYLGADAEYAAMNKAVTNSAGQVVMYNKRLASAVYSANGGGHEADREEGFGQVGADYPYLRAAPYTTQDPAPWHATVALTDVAARLRYPGVMTGARLGRTGGSGRAIAVVLEGSAGDQTVPGLSFAANLGLKSTLFQLQTGVADVAPGAPPPASLLQALPDDAAALAAATSRAAGRPFVVPDLPPGPAPRTGAGPTPGWLLLGAALLVGTATAGAGGVAWRQYRLLRD